MLVKRVRSNLGSLPVWTGNGPISCLISSKIVLIWTVSPRTLKFGLKTPYATLIKVARSNLGSLLVCTGNWPMSLLISHKIDSIDSRSIEYFSIHLSKIQCISSWTLPNIEMISTKSSIKIQLFHFSGFFLQLVEQFIWAEFKKGPYICTPKRKLMKIHVPYSMIWSNNFSGLLDPLKTSERPLKDPWDPKKVDIN